MAKTHVKPGCHNCADAICDECDDGTRSGRMTGGGPGAGPTIPKVHVSEERAAQGGHVGIILDDAPVIYDIDFETHSGMPLLYPYQREMLRDIMTTTPEFETPVEGDIYKDFVARYAKGDTTAAERRVGFSPHMGKPYGGKMRDYMRQHAYFASGDPDPLRSAAGRRFFVLGGGEGNRQLAYYAYGMALSRSADNWVDDVYDRKQRRAEAKLREYCMADVWIAADYAAIERRIIFTLLDGYPTVDVTHRLKAPYGREPSSTDWGIAISIRFTGLRPRGFVQDEPLAEWPDRQLADMIGGAVTGFGCPEFISRKVADTVYASGRYDCCITLSKLALLNLQSVMQELRCEVVVVCDDRRGWRGLPCYAPDSDKDMR
ncbi:hypothetical protein LESZY_00770 [Brevundimonas phage vB_BpoS-Leszy]|nr:hypothetical protein LESZY_00770 [Brevundimonas phage vB_BpoS-Leszy]